MEGGRPPSPLVIPSSLAYAHCLVPQQGSTLLCCPHLPEVLRARAAPSPCWASLSPSMNGGPDNIFPSTPFRLSIPAHLSLSLGEAKGQGAYIWDGITFLPLLGVGVWAERKTPFPWEDD